MYDITIFTGAEQRAALDVWKALVDAGVKLESAVSFFRDGYRIVHVVTDDPGAIRDAIAATSTAIIADEREALVVDLAIPAGIAPLAQKLTGAGLTVHSMFLATDNRMVVGVNDPARARAVLGDSP